LAKDQIETRENPLATTALEVISHPRRIKGSEAFRSGLIELQDAASQAVVGMLPSPKRVLDSCAGNLVTEEIAS